VTTEPIRVLAWNLFHGHDGARLGPTLASTVLRRPVDDGTHLHLNRTWIDAMGAVIATRSPTVAALQEVPPLAVAQLEAATGMRAAHALMPPLIGTTRLRGRWSRRNPDLWRTHEGTANVVLVAAPWTFDAGDVWTVRHNPPAFVARTIRTLGLRGREALHWLLEPRRLVAVRLRGLAGQRLTVVSLHCHDAEDPGQIAAEVRRAVPRVTARVPFGEPVIVAGDVNSRGADHPAIAALRDFGFAEDGIDRLGIDHVFHRDLDVVSPPAPLPRAVREHRVAWRGGTRIVVLSDHEILEASYRLRASPAA
jgi:endonuclease/exonuclease/phosphatase family metal-dependent hydrolase